MARHWSIGDEDSGFPTFNRGGGSTWGDTAEGGRQLPVKTWGRGTNWRDRPKSMSDPRIRLPICPYGCSEEGQLKEIVMGQGGQAVGIYADSDGCVFRADIQLGEPPTKRKLVIGPDGEMHEEEG